MNKRTDSQRAKIKAHLEKGNSITPLEALTLCGCFRLASIIHNLKNEGLDIRTDIKKDGGKKYASYSLKIPNVNN